LAASRSLVVIRFSSLGDVAMTIPILTQTLQQHPQLHILLVSNHAYKPLFEGIERLEFFGADLKKRHAGLLGIFRLFNDIRRKGFVFSVADLHGVLRSYLLSFLFAITGTATARIQKGRFQKWQLTRRWKKIIKPLPTTFERYQRVLDTLGFHVAGHASTPTRSATTRKPHAAAENFLIGVAPFAKHPEKMLPLSTLQEALTQLQQQFSCTLFLFGAPGKEAALLSEWASKNPKLVNMATGHSLTQELEVIKQLDLMIAMDSANMHLASLYAVPVVSIWGATHPYAGFLGWGQSMQQVVQAELPCRPCSVYGNKKCYRGDWACLQAIQAIDIVEKVRSYLCPA
jgi:ADP-heptose:LPS heptosyltransferase